MEATETDPMKSGEAGVEDGQTPPTQLKKKKSCSEGLGFTKLSHWRTAAFFFSLFLCLTIVFAFSFIMPCPVRPQYLSAWNRTFPQAATYDFLDIEDANKDKVLDVLFIRKDSVGGPNITCAGLPTPCLFVSAVAGTNGMTLWELPLAPDFQWGQCGLEGLNELERKEKGCLLSHADQLTAIDKYKGVILWQRPQPPGLNSTLPVLSVPDLDGDGFSDVALVAPGPLQTQLVFLSGKTGVQIGSEVVLDTTETAKHLLHPTPKDAHYVLLQKDFGLYGLALWRIAAKAKEGAEAHLNKNQNWESKADPITGFVPVYESDSLRHVLRIKTDSPNLLLLTEDAVLLVDGNSRVPLWTVNTSTVLSEPSFGHFNDDEKLDFVIEEDNGNGTKRVVILNGQTGGILWEASLLASPNSPRPASVNTINSFSVFMFWGGKRSETNSSISLDEEHRSYMLHPRYSKFLLEKKNIRDHIIAFKATLLEKGRHACYILLTGPQSKGEEGTVVLRKRKLKQDVSESRVLRIGAGGSSYSNEDILEAFNRLRFK
ncbi:protein FAM234A [Osmerus mordax]|uniref:protein FAM234A n=1 Tax=Osmerus mordax TaxID=8014 RepID=UPI003510038D